MDAIDVVGAVGLIIIIVLAVLVLTPILGEVMYYIISNWFGHDIDKELYWTGVGLIAVAGMIVGVGKKNED